MSIGYESDYLWIPAYNSLSASVFSKYECEEAI